MQCNEEGEGETLHTVVFSSSRGEEKKEKGRAKIDEGMGESLDH